MSTDFNNFFAVDSNGIVAIRSSFNFLRCVKRDSTGAGTLWFLSVKRDAMNTDRAASDVDVGAVSQQHLRGQVFAVLDSQVKRCIVIL